jgi:hypothetical protein
MGIHNEERTQFHLDKAEYLLEMAGEPKTPDQMFTAAAASAMLGLAGQIRTGMTIISNPNTTPLAEWEKELLLPANGAHVDSKTQAAWDAIDSTGDFYRLISAVRAMEHMVPDWQNRKIQAIKEIRQSNTASLKESKDLVEALAERRRLGLVDFW